MRVTRDGRRLAPTASLDDEWCTINAAARRLGVTATAIRNRIKRGTLETRPNGNFGRLVRVPLNGETGDPHPRGTGDREP